MDIRVSIVTMVILEATAARILATVRSVTVTQIVNGVMILVPC